MSHRPDPLRPSRYGELSALQRHSVDQLVNAIASHAGNAPLLTEVAALLDELIELMNTPRRWPIPNPEG